MFYIMNNHFGSIARSALRSISAFQIRHAGAQLRHWRHPSCTYPSAARLFVDFMLSDAQEIMQKNNEHTLRADVKPPAGMPAFGELAMAFDIDRALGEQQNLLQWWQEVTE